MNAIDKIYTGFNFSTTRCYVIEVLINLNGYVKIEQKLPVYVQNLKGIFISVSCKPSSQKLAGYTILNFNGQALKILQLPILRTTLLKDCSKPIPFDEIIKPGSLLQGFYYDATGNALAFPYTLCIYLHYEPIEEINN